VFTRFFVFARYGQGMVKTTLDKRALDIRRLLTELKKARKIDKEAADPCEGLSAHSHQQRAGALFGDTHESESRGRLHVPFVAAHVPHQVERGGGV
jgi:hypothetical protein